MKNIIAILALLATTTAAQAQMSAAEFEAYVTGKTLFYSVNGDEYGVERYMDGRRVQWSFLDGECTDGVWYEDRGRICFAYDGWETEQCWRFEQVPGGLIAEFAGPGDTQSRYMAMERDEEMLCLGPKIGV